MVTSAYAEGNERSCKVVNVITELAVCPRVVKSCVSESVLVGKFLANTVENLGEGEVYKFVFLPDVLSGFCVVVKECVALALGISVF